MKANMSLAGIFLALVISIAFFATEATASAIPNSESVGYDTDGATAGIQNSHPHNLSSGSSAPISAGLGGEGRVCVFCHTPHAASTKGPLWNRPDPAGPFPLYGSPLVIAETYPGSPAGSNTRSGYGVGEYPNGASRLCLSCHDGVTAVGEVLNGGTLANLTMSAKGTIDLTNAHPISFTYDAAVVADINTPKSGYTLPAIVSLDGDSRMQCTTCHDPHIDTFEAGIYELPMWANDTGVEDADYTNTCNDCHGAGFRSLFNLGQGAGDGHDTPL